MTNFKNFVVRKGLEVAESIKLNGKTVTSLIDSAGATVLTTSLIDSSYVQARTAAGGNDSATTIALIDSSYVQTRQIKYTNADFTDSAYVTTQINSVIDAAPGALDTLNELAAALGDDANFSTTITNQIAGKLDSAGAIALIDSSYVQARTAAGGNDSATTIALIDSSYVQTRQITPPSSFNTISVTGNTNIVSDPTGLDWTPSTQQAKVSASPSGSSGAGFGDKTDLSGDGTYAVVGARTQSGGGVAYVLLRTGSSWAVQQKLTAGSNTSFAHGARINETGDAIVIGSTDVDNKGAAYVYTSTKLVDFDTATVDYSQASQSSLPNTGIVSALFNGNGTKMYLLGYSPARVYSYTLTTPYDISTAGSSTGIVSSLNLGAQPQPIAMRWNNNGTTLFAMQSNPSMPQGATAHLYYWDQPVAYDIVAWNLSSARGYLTFIETIHAPSGLGGVRVGGFDFSADGTKLIIVHTTNTVVKLLSYNLSTAFDITSITQTSRTENYILVREATDQAAAAKDISSLIQYPKSFAFNENGTRFFMTTGYNFSANASIETFSLSTPYDITSTLTHISSNRTDAGSINVSETAPRDITFSPDYTKAYIGGMGNDAINQFDVISNSTLSIWSQQQKIQPSGMDNGDNFGNSVDISNDGNIIVVGHQYDDVGGTNSGSAYIFTRSGSTWTQQIKLAASNAAAGYNFGHSVAISGDGGTVIIGAPGKTSVTGSAYIFTGSGSTWTEQAEIAASDAATSQNFAYSVAIDKDGNTVAIGSMDDADYTNAGAVYVFTTTNGTSWSQQTKISSPNATAADWFGSGLAGAVDISDDGTTIIVGAYNDTGNGAAYIFKRSGSTWTQKKRLVASDAASNDRFGWNVAISGDATTGIVGATNDTATNAGDGTAYVFIAGYSATYSDTLTFTPGTGITLTTNATTDTVTIAGTAAGLDSAGATALIDSSYVQARQTTYDFLDSAEAISLIDSSYVQARQTKYTNADFTDSAFVTTQINSVIDAAPGALDTLNELAAALGDDANFSTTITNQIADKLDSAGAIALIDSSYVQARQGAGGNDSATTIALIDSSYVQTRQITPVSSFNTISVTGQTDVGADTTALDWTSATDTQAFQQTGNASGDGFGSSISIDGDYMIVGAPQVNPTNTGAAYIFYNNGSTWAQQAALTSGNSDIQGMAGTSVAILGDHCWVGMRGHSSSRGKIQAYSRSGTTWTAGSSFTGSATGVYLGENMHMDGNSMIVGEPYNNYLGSSPQYAGKAYVYTRSGSTWSLEATLVSGDTTGIYFGRGVDIHGDTAVVAAHGSSGGGTDAGAFYVFTRSGTTWTKRATINGAAAHQYFGKRITVFEGPSLTTIAVSRQSSASDVRIYTGSGSTYTLQQTIPAPSGNHSLGVLSLRLDKTAASDGNYLIIGAQGAWNTQGKAYIYSRSGTTWTLANTLDGFTLGPNNNDQFGGAVEIQNNTVAVGASGYSTNASNHGAAYIVTAGQSAVYSDTLTFAAGTGITLTTNATSDTVTIAGSAAGLDSAGATALIDSAYVQARQTKYTNADFTDSAYVTTQINSLIGGAPGTLDTLNEIAAALNDDDSAYSTLVGLISAKSDLDSSAAISLIDSDYVQARVTASSSVTQSDTAPSSPSAGDLWFDTTDATLFVYYTDSDGAQWVTVSGPTGPTGATGATGAATFSDLTDVTIDSGDPLPTSNPSSGKGHFWINKTSGNAYVLTDASDSDNLWTNIGDGTGSIAGSFGATGGATATYTDSADSLAYKSHTFTSSGNFVITDGNNTVQYMLIAGGGGGGGHLNDIYANDPGGGGGAGGLLIGTATMSAGTYSITIGSGGASSSTSTGANGGNTVLGLGGGGSATAIGGGGAGSGAGNNTTRVGLDGGSGGGGGGSSGQQTVSAAGSGTVGQGNAGGTGGAAGTYGQRGGGGGGAGAVGEDAPSNRSGAGGIGLVNKYKDASGIYYAGGGGAGGSTQTGVSTLGQAGGTGGGGAGGNAPGSSNAATNGTVNTGGGGGGAGGQGSIAAYTGANGGSGVVVLRYTVS